MTKEQMESELENLKEKFELLAGKVELLEIIAKQPVAPKVEESPTVKLVKLIQINVKPKYVYDKTKGITTTRMTEKGRSYFCRTPDEQLIFNENNPGADTETFTIEVQEAVAKKYLEDPDNKAQFEKKAPVEETVNV